MIVRRKVLNKCLGNLVLIDHQEHFVYLFHATTCIWNQLLNVIYGDLHDVFPEINVLIYRHLVGLSCDLQPQVPNKALCRGRTSQSKQNCKERNVSLKTFNIMKIESIIHLHGSLLKLKGSGGCRISYSKLFGFHNFASHG